MSREVMNFSSNLGIPAHEFRLVFGRTKIEYDHNKDEENRKKHKYALESAVWLLKQILFPTGRNLPCMISDSFLEKEEVRHQHMCVDDNGHVVFFVTTMRDDEAVRVVSMRRAHENERIVFQQKTGYIEGAPQICAISTCAATPLLHALQDAV